MVKWKCRSCQRCGGDMFIGSDIYGWYQQCLQCSHRVDLKNLTEFKEPVGHAPAAQRQ